MYTVMYTVYTYMYTVYIYIYIYSTFVNKAKGKFMGGLLGESPHTSHLYKTAS